jgi:ParB/RepB/Spo0J family partition protein
MTDPATQAPQPQRAPDVQLIPVADLRPSPFQPRVREGGRADPALVASVKVQGVIQPLVVRFLGCDECHGSGRNESPGLDSGVAECGHCDGTGTLLGYELMAGHRRLDAARRAKLDAVPCVVREATDAEAAAIVHAENAHRLDLSPVESAAIVASALAAHGGNVSRAARALGLSRQAVLRRARLAQLSPAWRAAAADPASVVAGWGAAHLEAVARLPEESQEALYRRLALDGLPARPTVEDVERLTVAGLHFLANAPFDREAADLVPVAGRCRECPKRSAASPGLFGNTAPDSVGDRCLDPTCWERKVDAKVVTFAEAHQLERGVPITLLRTRTYPKGAPAPPLADQARDAGGYEELTGDMICHPEALMALFVDGARRGKHPVWVRPLPAPQRLPAAPPALPKIGRPTKAEAARRRAQEARCGEILAALASATPAQLPDLLDLVALVSAASATEGAAEFWESYDLTWRRLSSVQPPADGLRRALWDVARGWLKPRAAAIRDVDARLAFLERLREIGWQLSNPCICR